MTVEYDEGGNPVRVDTVVISTQHRASVSVDDLGGPLVEHVISPVLEEAAKYLPNLDIGSYDLFINPTGRFVKGGPAADSGLTGRKIIVDTYGGYAAHGGGAFSGKDPTKVDRSAAYAARHIAKNIVAASIASKCQVQLAYAIGVAQPVSIRVDTYGTSEYSEKAICDAIEKVYDLTPAGIINWLDLRKPIYKATSAYGHFGNVTGDKRSWEQLDTAEHLKAEIR